MAPPSQRIGELIDGLIEPFSPRTARRRAAERLALKTIRSYDAADTGRRTQGWRRPATSADRETMQGLVRTRNGARELVRNNKYAASAVRQIVSNMVGDGITATLGHADATIKEKAQAAWDDWAENPVDGREDFYGVQKMTARSVIEGGETLLHWTADRDGPDGRVRGLEGDFLDHLRFNWMMQGAPGRIVQGVEFDQLGDRAAYWLFREHPGDIGGFGAAPERFPAQDIDHVFEALRWGQTRGISWFAPAAIDLRDVADFEDAVRMKKKVEACLALILTPPDGSPASPLSDQQTQDDPAKPSIETVRPGMIFRAKPGETASTLAPTSSGDGVDFVRQQLMGIAANLVPYHLMTGDVSQANYSSLRACLLGFWANLDDWQQNMMVPFCCKPAVQRRMARLAVQTGDKRFLQVKPTFAMPPRRFVDPIKDLAGELGEVRAGFKALRKSLAERGINLEAHFADLAATNKLIDSLGLAIEADPRRLTDLGVLQIAAGYIAPKGDRQRTDGEPQT